MTPRMRPRCKDWGKEQHGRTRTHRAVALCGAVDRSGHCTAPPLAAIRCAQMHRVSGLGGCPCPIHNAQHQPPGARDAPYAPDQCCTLRVREVVQTHHHAAAWRQRTDAGQQMRIIIATCEQPDARDGHARWCRKVAGPHHRTYKARDRAAPCRDAPRASLMRKEPTVTVAPVDTHAAERLDRVRHGIADAARIAQRDASVIELIAVSKTQPEAAITTLLEQGHRSFGENRVQQAQAKWPALRAQYPDVRLHLVGQLQSNKADDAVALFDVIHSVDRPSLIAALARACADQRRAPQMLIQVNIGDEPQKGGCAVADVPSLLAQARDAGLTISGLMAVPPVDVEPAPYFALLQKLARDHELPALSMGMSDDYPTAVMLGATMVRVGTALFGTRPAA